jgi:putative transcriptional regulator
MTILAKTRPAGKSSEGYLEGQILIAMPNMADPKFEQSVLFLCAHSKQGAMGLVLNKLVGNISFADLLSQLHIATPEARAVPGIPVQFGGPVETGRGFVLHSPDYSAGHATAKVGSNVGLTATIDILKAMADGEGPREKMVALGYAGWGAGQLESEIQRNSWLTCPADDYLLYGQEWQNKWDYSIRKLGFNPSQLSGESGRA